MRKSGSFLLFFPERLLKFFSQRSEHVSFGLDVAVPVLFFRRIARGKGDLSFGQFDLFNCYRNTVARFQFLEGGSVRRLIDF